MSNKLSLRERRKRVGARKPKGRSAIELSRVKRPRPLFTIQEHAGASHHYHIHLVEDGRVRSWRILNGPSLDPKKRQPAVREDRSIGAAMFEGVVPQNEYDPGTLIVWDKGNYRVVSHPSLKDALRRGLFKIRFRGKKIIGDFIFIQLLARNGKEWYIQKLEDLYDRTFDIRKKRESVLTDRTIEEVAKEEGGPLSPEPPPR